ncbi:WXG100 family type VII secretion target [Nocardia sp. NPDC051321]|uniref:WXG100 family type VII secretion target n=1 Tax=Nocardia sp. NPDC051321 TaxID=3364323 RepID=UPI00379A8E39
MALTNLAPSGDTVALEAQGITAVAQQLTQAIENLRASVKAIDHAAMEAKKGWKGDANDAFVRVANEWDQEATALNTKFDRFNEAVENGKKTLLAMDQT